MAPPTSPPTPFSPWPLSIHVVPHTHWDREWYHALGRFRQLLVSLVDDLLDDPPPRGESFLLDGQAVVVEDYLAVRPERRDELVALLDAGRLEAGPWYVLADGLIPSGEALVRNLFAGRHLLASLGAGSPPVLYCPDAFGHPAALPELARGFGLPVVVAWRGFGSRRWPHGDAFEWRAPSGASAILFHLPSAGYEFGSNLPHDDAGARARWARIRDALAPRNTTGVALVQNGADHHARQRQYRQALAALERAAGEQARVHGSSMHRFAEELIDAAKKVSLPVVTGELRDSYGYTWTLQGTFATRAHQKRTNARAERVLIREAEPFAAIAMAQGGGSRRPLTAAAWRALLQAHPHDTLCGCSIDEVARAMDVRVADALDQGRGVLEDAVLDLVGHDREAARERRAEWQPAVVVRNSAPRARGGVVIAEVDDFVADAPVGPGSAGTTTKPRAEPQRELSPAIAGTSWVQLLGGARTTYDRIESPRHYPDNDLVVRRRLALWVEPIPGYGIAMLRRDPSADRVIERVVFVETTQLAAAPADAPPAVDRPHQPEGGVGRDGAIAGREGAHLPFAQAARAGGKWPHGVHLDNGIVSLVAHDGTISLEDRAGGRRLEDVVRVEDLVDAGDLYTPSLRGKGLRPELHDARVVHRGPLVATITACWRLVDAAERVGATFEVDFSLYADSPVLHLDVRGENGHPDHRLRLSLHTGIDRAEVRADAAFGVVHRPPLVVPPEDAAMEHPQPTAPLHRYVSLFGGGRGATVFSDGLAEYEATSSGTVFVTVLRAVGELSRNDLPERPGHAGWPTPTPLAQSIGPFEASLAFMLHGPRSDETVVLVERTADDVLLPLTGTTLRSALRIAPATLNAELVGDGLAFSALKESEDGAAIVARCVNLLDRDVEGAWRFGFPVREAHRARLDETLLEKLEAHGGRVAFRAAPRAVVTILVRTS